MVNIYDKKDILGINVDNVSMAQALDMSLGFLKDSSFHMIFTPNSEIIMESTKDRELKKILNNASLLIPDGAGVILASKILKTPLKEKVAGIELSENILKSSACKPLRVFLFGGKPGIAKKAAGYLKNKYPDIEIAGYENGYFDHEEEKKIIKKINDSKAHIVFTALGAPKQEKLIYRHKDSLNVNIAMGVGGIFDIWAGEKKRGPALLYNNYLEWLYRLIKEPFRIKRMLKIPVFLFLALKKRFL